MKRNGKKSKGRKKAGRKSKEEIPKEKADRKNIRARRYDYDTETQKLIDHAALDLRAKLMATDPFSDEESFMAEAYLAWDRAKVSTSIHIKLGDGILMTV